jgi:hypothetical protein
MPITTANVSTTTAAVYTSAGDSAITFLSLCNYSGTTSYANVFVVPNGNTAGNLNLVLANIALTSQDTYQLYAGGEKLILSTGDTVQINASGNSAVTAVTSYTSI